MTIKPEVLAAVYLIADPESTGNQIIESEKTILTELTRLSEIADTVDPLVVRLGEVTEKVEAQTKMLADCYRMSDADPDGNEDWRLARNALQAVTELRRDYDEAEDWQLKCMNAETRLERADALLRELHATVRGESPHLLDEDSGGNGTLDLSIEAHLSEPRT